MKQTKKIIATKNRRKAYYIGVPEDQLIQMFCYWFDFVVSMVFLSFLKFIICYGFSFHLEQIFDFITISSFIILDSFFLKGVFQILQVKAL